MAADTKQELRKRTQQSIKVDDIAAVSLEHKEDHHEEHAHSHELFQSMKGESKRLIFDAKKYSKEKVFCSQPEKDKIPV